MKGLDNQQERLAFAAYLAGIIDGEGWVGLTLDQKKYQNKHQLHTAIRPIIAIHMVGPDWIDHLVGVCKKLELPCWAGHFKTSSRIGFYGMKRCAYALGVLRPHLYIKAKQADLMLEMIEIRLNRPYHDHNTSPREFEILEEVRALNMKGKNPQRLYAERREELRRR